MEKLSAGKFHFEPPSLVSLFDHLVGPREQRRRYVEAECLCSLKIDDKLELRRLHDRKIGGLSALENVAGIYANVTKTVGDICSVAHQRAGFDQFAPGDSHGDAFACCERGELHPAAGVEC